MQTKKIRDIAKVRRGASPRPIDDPKYFGGEVGWIRITDVSASKKYLRSTTQYVSKLGEYFSVRVDKGDLIISIAGTIGRPIIVDIPACIHDGFVHIFNLKDTDTEFLYYYLQYLENSLVRFGQSGTQTNLNSEIVGNVEINWFHKPEQTCIAQILSKADEAIFQTEALIAKYQRIKNGLMQDLLTKGIDENGNIRSKATHKFAVKNGIEVPEEWDVVSIEFIIRNRKGAVKIGPFGSQLKKDFFVEDGIKVYGQENVFYNDFSIGERRIDETRFEHLKSCEIFPGDVLITMMGTIGKCVVVPEGIERGIMDSHLLRIQLDESRYNKFFLMIQIAESENIIRQIKNLSIGSIMEGLNSKIIHSLLFVKPKMIEQSKIIDLLTTTENHINSLRSNLLKLISIKNGLMQDLLSGKVRITVDN